MKKAIIALFAALTLTAHAGMDILGQVVAKNANTITVQVASKQFVIGVTPFTEIEAENQWGWDYRIPFHAIKVGEWIKADVYPSNNGTFLAEDIEVFRQ